MFRISQKEEPRFVFDEYFLQIGDILIEVTSMSELWIHGPAINVPAPEKYFDVSPIEDGIKLTLLDVKAPVFRKEVSAVVNELYNVINGVLSLMAETAIDVRIYADPMWARRERF